MRSEEFLTEVGITVMLGDHDLPPEYVRSATVVGEVRSVAVYMCSYNNQTVYFSKQNESDAVSVYAVIMSDSDSNGYHHLRAIRKYSSGREAEDLVRYCVVDENLKLLISSTEPLSYKGMKWVCRVVTNGIDGVTITDQTGNQPTPSTIENEWHDVRMDDDLTPGPTEIRFE